jgi:phosphoglycerate dehydrogenase-like enzyme
MRMMIHSDKAGELLEPLQRRHPDVELCLCTDYTSLPQLLRERQPEVLYTIRFAGTPGFPRAAIIESPSLRWVSVGGSGTDHIAPWDARRLTVTNAAGVGAATMAQYAIAAALYFTLGLPDYAAAQRRRSWVPGNVGSLEGRRLLILGLGKTGQAVARLAKAHGMEVTGVRANPAPTPFVDRVEPPARLAALLPATDILVVAVPLTAATRGLLDATAFARLKPGAVLIDVSRGGVVRHSDLVAGLTTGRLRGAALDVFETEPLPAGDPLWAMENVIITPHCTSVWDGWALRSIEMLCDNIDRWKRGERLTNIVDPQRGY